MSQSVAIRGASEGDDRAFNLGPVGSNRPQLNPKRWRYRLDDGKLANSGASGGVSNHRHPAHVRHDFLEQFEPFSAQAVFEESETGRITTRSRQAIDKTPTNWVHDLHEHNRDSAGSLQQRRDGDIRSGQYDIRGEHDQFRGISANAFGIARSPAMFYPQVLLYGPAQLR